jgi:glutaredoxin
MLRPMKTVTLYTKLGCHLCEAVEAVLANEQVKCSFHFIRRDISEDAADYEKYKHDIPVILVDNLEIARHRLTVEQLRAALGT